MGGIAWIDSNEAKINYFKIICGFSIYHKIKSS